MAAEEEAPSVNAIADTNKTTSNANTNPPAKGSDSEWMEGLQPTVIESKNIAISSARSFGLGLSSLSLFTEELMSVREHSAAVVGFAITAGLLLMQGPRRFLFRHTLGQLQSEEAQYLKAEKNVKEFSVSVDLMKKESKKLLERVDLAEKEMKRGQTELIDAGSQIQSLAKSVYNVETQATDLVGELRQMRGREALQLRAEVASMASILKQQRVALNKWIMKIPELGVPV